MTKIYKLSGLGNPQTELVKGTRPPKIWLPISTSTTGEIALLVEARRLLLAASLNNERQNTTLAYNQQAAANLILDKYARGIHGSEDGKLFTNNSQAAKHAASIARQSEAQWQPAVLPKFRAKSDLNFFVGNTNDFQPGEFSQYADFREETACREKILRNMGYNKFRDYFREIDPKGLQSENWYRYDFWLKKKGQWDEFKRLFQECVMPKAFERMINEKIESAGPTFLYNLMGLESDENVKRIIAMKAYQGSSWIAQVGNITGLDKELIRNICRNGVLASDMKDSPENIKGNIYNMLLPPKDNIGALDPITLSIIIIVAVGAAAKVAVSIIAALKNDFGAAQRALDSLPGIEALLPAKAEMTSTNEEQETPPSEGGEETTPSEEKGNMVIPLAAAAAAYFILK